MLLQNMRNLFCYIYFVRGKGLCNLHYNNISLIPREIEDIDGVTLTHLKLSSLITTSIFVIKQQAIFDLHFKYFSCTFRWWYGIVQIIEIVMTNRFNKFTTRHFIVFTCTSEYLSQYKALTIRLSIIIFRYSFPQCIYHIET